MNTWITFSIYLIYRFIRFIIHLIEARIIWRFNGVLDHLSRMTRNPTATQETYQILSIIFRKKLVDGDMTNANDFIWWHEKFLNPDELIRDPHWTLYTLDKDYAYFLRMPEKWTYYNARRAPFVYMKQFPDAQKLARMPLNAFYQFSKKLQEPKGPVVYYSNAARSGSTLLARVMQVSEDRIFCVGEPDAFTALSILHERGFITDDLASNLLKAIFKFYCAHQLPGQTYFMKVQSNGVRLVPLIKKVMPNVKHMFTYRKNTRRILSSLEKILRGATAGDVMVALWKIHPELAYKLVSLGGYEYEFSQQFGFRDCLELSILIHVSSFYQYYTHEHMFHLPLINYEDLIEEKEKTLKKIFHLCEVPYNEFIENALEEFKIDSQGGTMLSQENMKTVRDSPLDEKKVKKMNEICDTLKIPRIPVD